MLSEGTLSQSVHVNQLQSGIDEQSISISDAADTSVSPLIVDVETSEVEHRFLDAKDGLITPQENTTMNADDTSTLQPSGEMVTANKVEDSVKEMRSNGSVCTANVEGSVQDTKSDGSISVTANETEGGAEVKKSDEPIGSANISRSSDVHLNIRLPNGSSLRAIFSMTDTLGLVKDFVDENGRSVMGPYNLAIPYPRKVFNEQGEFSELCRPFPFSVLMIIEHLISYLTFLGKLFP